MIDQLISGVVLVITVWDQYVNKREKVRSSLAWNKIPRFFLTDDLAVGEVTNMFLKLSIVHLKPYYR